MEINNKSITSKGNINLANDALYLRQQFIILNFSSIPMLQQAQKTCPLYQPFKYPPDYELAKTHQKASMPGKANQPKQQCPCCHEKVKRPFKSWWNRSIQKDFKSYGGGVVGYFWLLKLYSLSVLAIIIIYGGYLQYLTNHFCSIQQSENEKCAKFYGLWVVTNSDLQILIKEENDTSALARFYTLRGVLLLVLLVVNILSIYLIKWFKTRHPDKLGTASFSLLFKNIKNNSIDDLVGRLQQQFGPLQVRQAFILAKAQPFYSHYQNKLETYYACKIEQNSKQKKKLKDKLNSLNQLCIQQERSFNREGSRAIIVFQNFQTKQKILKKYQISKWKILQMFFSNDYEQQFRMYCQKAPKPEQIIWNNISIVQKQSVKVKILSIIYFILIISFFVGFLYYFMDIVYVQPIIQPFKSILTNIILIFVVLLGLTFRSLMVKLSEMRHPNTYTNRAIFTVVTTVVFHFIFYLFVPSLYLYFHSQLRGATLSLISSQVVSFIIIQITLAAFDLMYCKWNKSKAQTQNQDKPIGCQKILHQKMQYPRFPIEFKLIVLFKIWSLITFFAFQVPLILFLILVVLIFLYVKDKMNIYYHYRMQTIDNQVQFKFLKIYSNVFSFYLLLTFLAMQNDLYQMIIGGVGTLVAMFIQTFYVTKLNQQPSDYQSFVAPKLNDLSPIDSYKKRYEKFMQQAQNDIIDQQINQYLLQKKDNKRKKQIEQDLLK